jgi:hypothetical protein
MFGHGSPAPVCSFFTLAWQAYMVSLDLSSEVLGSKSGFDTFASWHKQLAESDLEKALVEKFNDFEVGHCFGHL